MGRVSVLRTLFLHPPSFQGFDGGAGSRYQARREIRSFWYPTWLAQPAALVAGSRLVDAPPADLTLADVLPLAREYELAVLHTSAPSFGHDVKVAEALKGENPALRIGLVGAHVAVQREAALAASPALDFVCGNEFDFTIREIAEGRALASAAGLSYRDAGGELRRTPERATLEDMDALPWVVDVYARDLEIERYAIGYLQHPYVSLYTGRGCPGARQQDPRHVHPGPAGRDARDDRGDDPVRAGDRSSHAPGLARRALSGHRALPRGARARLARDREPRGRAGDTGERDRLSAPAARRDLPFARDVLPALLLPAAQDLRPRRGDVARPRGHEAPARRGAGLRALPGAPPSGGRAQLADRREPVARRRQPVDHRRQRRAEACGRAGRALRLVQGGGPARHLAAPA